jgi:hypothetical protein
MFCLYTIYRQSILVIKNQGRLVCSYDTRRAFEQVSLIYIYIEITPQVGKLYCFCGGKTILGGKSIPIIC